MRMNLGTDDTITLIRLNIQLLGQFEKRGAVARARPACPRFSSSRYGFSDCQVSLDQAFLYPVAKHMAA